MTNDDRPGTIVIVKVTKPTGSPVSFPFDATGTGYNDFSLTGQSPNNSNSQQLNAGTYTVTELVPAGWALTGLAHRT